MAARTNRVTRTTPTTRLACPLKLGHFLPPPPLLRQWRSESPYELRKPVIYRGRGAQVKAGGDPTALRGGIAGRPAPGSLPAPHPRPPGPPAPDPSSPRPASRSQPAGRTRLATGESVSKADLRVEAYGAADETNACLGLARLHTEGELDSLLGRVQNELFDLGADLATPPKPGEVEGQVLRVSDRQVERLEGEIDAMNAALPELTSFVLPGGTPAAAALHLARTVCRRAERSAVRLAEAGEPVSGPALRYLNRLSDLLFVAARFANGRGASEVFWKSGATR